MSNLPINKKLLLIGKSMQQQQKQMLKPVVPPRFLLLFHFCHLLLHCSKIILDVFHYHYHFMQKFSIFIAIIVVILSFSSLLLKHQFTASEIDNFVPKMNTVTNWRKRFSAAIYYYCTECH